MSNFKAGDLALLVKATNPENLMKCVSILRRAGQEKHDLPGCDWVIEGALIGDAEEFQCPDSWLAPLRGDFQPEQQKSREAPA